MLAEGDSLLHRGPALERLHRGQLPRAGDAKAPEEKLVLVILSGGLVAAPLAAPGAEVAAPAHVGGVAEPRLPRAAPGARAGHTRPVGRDWLVALTDRDFGGILCGSHRCFISLTWSRWSPPSGSSFSGCPRRRGSFPFISGAWSGWASAQARRAIPRALSRARRRRAGHSPRGRRG